MFGRKNKLIETLSNIPLEERDEIFKLASVRRQQKETGNNEGDTQEDCSSLYRFIAGIKFGSPLWLPDNFELSNLFICGPYSRIPDRRVLTKKFDKWCRSHVKGHYVYEDNRQFFADSDKIICQFSYIRYSLDGEEASYTSGPYSYYATQDYGLFKDRKTGKVKITENCIKGLRIFDENPAIYNLILRGVINSYTPETSEERKHVLICGDQETLERVKKLGEINQDICER